MKVNNIHTWNDIVVILLLYIKTMTVYFTQSEEMASQSRRHYLRNNSLVVTLSVLKSLSPIMIFLRGYPILTSITLWITSRIPLSLIRLSNMMLFLQITILILVLPISVTITRRLNTDNVLVRRNRP